MVELCEEFLFVHDGVDTALADDARLGHFFHGEQFALFALLDLPHLAKAATPNHILEMEVVLVNCCRLSEGEARLPW